MASVGAVFRGGPAEVLRPFAELGQRRCRQIIEAKCQRSGAWSLDSTRGCWLALKGLNSAGYGVTKAFTNEQIRAAAPDRPLRNTEKNYLLHKIAFAGENGRDLVGVGSHLCGEKSCFNPAHIVDESQSVNISRNYCPGEIRCSGGRVLLQNCAHVPSCIKVTVVPCCAPDSHVHPTIPAGALIGVGFSQQDLSTLAGTQDFELAESLEVEFDGDSDCEESTSPAADSSLHPGPSNPTQVPSSPPGPTHNDSSSSGSGPVLPPGGVAGHTRSTSLPELQIRESKRLRDIEASQAPPAFRPSSSVVQSSDFIVEEEEEEEN